MQPIAAIIALAFVVTLTSPGVAFGADQQACSAPLAVPGSPSRLRALAQLNAVRNWALRAEATERRSAQWHNAADRQIDCEELPNSPLIRCIAKAKPCPGPSPDPSREAKKKKE